MTKQKLPLQSCAPIALTLGDPSGVGPEITMKAWLHHKSSTGVPCFFAIGDTNLLRDTAKHLGLNVPFIPIESPRQAQDVFDEGLPVFHQPLKVSSQFGHPHSDNAQAVIRSIETAVEFTKKNHARAIVTNPIAKDVLYEAGFLFPGHTEFLAHLAGSDILPVMMLSCNRLRVVLATVHVSIMDAINGLNSGVICDVARVTYQSLIRDFSIPKPTIAVAGLNPHAGEGGAMGREEIDIITPAIERLQAEGMTITGPFPPDTLFTKKALPTYDVALCMYHDQGLIPLKALDFERGVNSTLGLPFVRTSPDHGTAFDIAGTGQASALSLLAALTQADQMARSRSGYKNES